jgi:hypothetical protein
MPCITKTSIRIEFVPAWLSTGLILPKAQRLRSHRNRYAEKLRADAIFIA